MLSAQQPSTYVDAQGVLRWSASRKEVYGFGVNYTVPFAHAYRSAKKLGIDPKAAMKADIYHMSRLGFDAYRVHIWDTEISDTLGNLLENEHLDAFDWMIAEMQGRGMNMLLTPIAFWGNGWPERDTWSPGFSHRYGKDACLTSEAAIAAQENYLAQLLNHVNPYTGVAYKNDPNVVAFEVSNEPHHRQSADRVARYVDKMISAMRGTGCQKPIFYNFSHAVHLVDAYLDGGAQGGTFQWYPTGLGAGEELQGNLLPNVDRYVFPFGENVGFQNSAKVVYEFDAADVARSYIYPAMGRSFRSAGIQWATHFAYDPTFLAYANTEYNTHYMNLAYAPQKALALKITGEVFHQIPRYQDFGAYPANTRFGDFLISYEQDLAVYNSGEKFFYTNHTGEQPKAEKQLREIAGWGNSPLVKYDGTGAYFLDQLEKGVWRLEVLPDVAWTDNLFGKNSLDRKLAEIIWHERRMQLVLQQLGADFTIVPVNENNTYQPVVAGQQLSIWPGTYLVVKKGVKSSWKASSKWKTGTVGDFSAPKNTLEQLVVLHEAPQQWLAGQTMTLKAKVLSPEPVVKVKVLTYDGWKPVILEMAAKRGFEYEVEVPGALLRAGMLSYYLQVETASGKMLYPAGSAAQPGSWDFDEKPYVVQVLEKQAPVYLYEALADDEEVSRNWVPGCGVVPTGATGAGELRLKLPTLYTPDPENLNETPIYDYAMRYSFGKKLAGLQESLAGKDTLVLQARVLDGPTTIQVALISSDAMTYGALVTLQPGQTLHPIALKDLKPVQLVTMPRPYPLFLPYYFDRAGVEAFDVRTIETLQISIGNGLSEAESKKPQSVGISAVWLK